MRSRRFLEVAPVFEDRGAEALIREAVRGDEPIVARADHDRVPRGYRVPLSRPGPKDAKLFDSRDDGKAENVS